MDQGYEVYCLADPLFYDSPTRVRGDDVDFERARRPVPTGWERTELADWLVYQPVGVQLPSQGWKVHVSASLDDAEAILAATWDYCMGTTVAFKFIRSLQLALLRNAKYADRGASGKFVTIYPADERQLETVIVELGRRLEGRHGPYILSDLRVGDGPLYVRYGGFAERYCIGDSGELELAIENDNGELVPDRRQPAFSIPDWVTLPAFLEPHLAARNSATVEDLPYRIERALHFSNGGGLYAGTALASGDPVVLKEARPYAGLAMDGADAVARLDRERDILGRLAGIDAVPRVHDFLAVGEHRFLVEDFVDGTPLSSLIAERYPLKLQEIEEDAVEAYTVWILDVLGRLEAAVDAIHERGVVIGDLHPFNVLVGPDDRVKLIDFEIASHVSEGRRPTIGDPGFVAPPSHTGFDVDRYALACCRLFAFLPLTSLFGIDRGKAAELATAIAGLFPVPDGFLDEAVAVITGPAAPSRRCPGHSIDPSSSGWEEARRSITSAILASATPHRPDRLFPGDVKQFETGGLNLAHGAAGVLYALAVTGAGRFPDHEEWLVAKATNPEPGTRLGLYDGLHGVAYVLDHLGRRSDALRVLDICAAELDGRWDRLGLDLHGGLSGIGLNLAHFARVTGDASFADAAWRVADRVADRLGGEDDVAPISGGEHPYAGLVRGSSGVALLFLRLYEHYGDAALLDVAATAIRQDLRRCFLRDEGTLEVNEGWRTMPYLADGGIGIGFVVDDFLVHRDDEQFADAAPALRRAAEGVLYIEPGLFYGRAGMILYLSRDRSIDADGVDPVVAAHIRHLGWHALTYEGHLAFPGEQLLRLSMDLATGSAGVLLALGAALHDEPVLLPFLAPATAGRVLDLRDLALTSGRR